MPVPDFQALMRPMLVVLDDGREQTLTELRAALAAQFELSHDEIDELLPSGIADTAREPRDVGGELPVPMRPPLPTAEIRLPDH